MHRRNCHTSSAVHSVFSNINTTLLGLRTACSRNISAIVRFLAATRLAFHRNIKYLCSALWGNEYNGHNLAETKYSKFILQKLIPFKFWIIKKFLKKIFRAIVFITWSYPKSTFTKVSKQTYEHIPCPIYFVTFYFKKVTFVKCVGM